MPVSGGGLPAAGVCGIGYYSSGGFCVQCPAGSVTRNLGATAIEECGELSCAAVGPQYACTHMSLTWHVMLCTRTPHGRGYIC